MAYYSRYPVKLYKTGKKDFRYTINKEFCGLINRAYVVRFCGDFLTSGTYEFCTEFAQKHSNTREINEG